MPGNFNSGFSDGKKGLIGRVCEFLWCKYSTHGGFRVTGVTSQNVGLVRGVHTWPVGADVSLLSTALCDEPWFRVRSLSWLFSSVCLVFMCSP